MTRFFKFSAQYRTDTTHVLTRKKNYGRKTLYKFSEIKYNDTVTAALRHQEEYMKRKIFALVLVVALVASVAVGLAACNDKNADGNSILFGKELLALTSQLDTLMELDKGGADIAVMDSIMAGWYAAQGDYAGKIKVLENMMLSEEYYGIAAESGAGAFMGKINDALIALYNNGTMTEIAAKYGLENEISIAADTQNPYADATDNSWNELIAGAENNTVTIRLGITIFAPIAIKDGDSYTGYDIELANAVFDYLGEQEGITFNVEPVVIDWDTKIAQINEAGSIDLIWNGMTITPELEEELTISIPYLANKQTCVVRTADYEKYSDIAGFLANSKDAIVAVESGSAADLIMNMEL